MKKILIFSDVHAPYHDKRAIKLVLKAGERIKPDVLICLGDFVDCFSVSAHRKDPRRTESLAAELRTANRVLDQFDLLRAKEKFYISGNHEDRLERYLIDKAPALIDTVQIEDLLKLKVRGWTYVPYKGFLNFGKVYYTHDLGYAGKYVAHRALADVQHSIVLGHVHRFSMAVDGDATGRPKVGASFGWLGDSKAADYMHQLRANKDWALGFGIGYMQSNGVTHFQPCPIVNYTCQIEGEILKA